MLPLVPEKLNQPSLTQAMGLVVGKVKTPVPATGLILLQSAPFYALKAQSQSQAGKDSRYEISLSTDVRAYRSYGFGAPALVAQLEDLRERGLRQVVVMGTAGALESSLEIGSVGMIRTAWRDEGTSFHYWPPSEKIHPPGPLSETLLRKLGWPGWGTWTTDAPFRETQIEVDHFRSKGAVIVEMEASAIFAWAHHWGLDCACVAVISDRFDESGWRPQFQDERIEAALLSATSQVIGALTTIST